MMSVAVIVPIAVRPVLVPMGMQMLAVLQPRNQHQDQQEDRSKE